jgi:hypothetical protein
LNAAAYGVISDMTEYRWIDGLCAISESFDLFLIDQFGVLHNGVEPYAGAMECLTRLKAQGKKVVLLSNSGKRASANRSRLLQFGFTAASFDHVLTSGEVAWQGIVDRTLGDPFVPGSRMFLVGHEDYDYGFDQIGLTAVENPASADFIMIAASRAPKMSLAQHLEALAAAAASKLPALCLQSGQVDAHRHRPLAERWRNRVALWPTGRPSDLRGKAVSGDLCRCTEVVSRYRQCPNARNRRQPRT